MKIWQLLMMLLISLPLTLSAASYTGQILDAMTAEGLIGAAIMDEQGQRVTSDEQGWFTIETSSKHVLIQLPGYDNKKVRLSPQLNIIKLSSSSFQIEAVTVEAEADEKKVVVSKQALEQAAITKTTSTIFQDVIQVVKKLPGVSSRNTSAQLYVRGGNSDEVIFSLDDAIIFNPYVFGGLVSLFNPSFVETVEFYAGGFTARWPQTMSAVLDVQNKRGNFEKHTGFFDLSLTTTDIFLEGPLPIIDGSSFLFGLRRTSYDLLVNLFLEGNIEVPYFYDGQLKTSFQLPHGQLDFSTLYAFEGADITVEFDDDDNDDTPPATAKFIAQNTKLNLSLRHLWELNNDTNVKTVLNLYTDRGRYDIGVTFNTIQAQVEQTILQVQHYWQWLIGDNQIVKAGLFLFPIQGRTTSDIQFRVPTVNDDFFIETISVREESAWETFNGFFLQDDIELIKDTLFINLGVNGQFYSLTNQWVVNPRFSGKVLLQPWWDLHFATGWYSQYPIDADLVTKLIDENPDLQAERAIHYIMGTKLDLAKQYSIQLEAYYKDYDQLIVDDPNPDLGFTNQGVGQAYGFDIIIQKELGDHWDGWITYSHIISERKLLERGHPEDFGVPANSYLEPVRKWYAVDFETQHVLNLVVNYSFDQAWKLALTQKIVTGTPYTPVLGAVYQPSIDEYVPIYGEYNSLRVPTSYITDVKLLMPFFGLPGWSSYLQVTNLFDVENITGYRYSNDYAERIAINELPRIFIVGARWEF